MKFPWFKPSTYKAVKILFNEFTPEERAILDGEDCAIPHMYSNLLKKSSRMSSSGCDLEEAKGAMEILFCSKESRANVRDPEIQKEIYLFFDGFLNCR